MRSNVYLLKAVFVTHFNSWRRWAKWLTPLPTKSGTFGSILKVRGEYLLRFYVIFVRHGFKRVQKNAETSGGGTAWMSI